MVRVSRRQLLQSSAGLGAIALTGCLGGGGGGNSSGSEGGMTSISVGIPSASTTTGAASNAFQRVVREVSSNTGPAGSIRWISQETGGDPPSLRQLSRGNLQAMTGGNFIIASAKQDLPPFQQQPIDSIPPQAMSIATLDMHIVAVDGSGVQTTNDLVGKKFWPLPPQWGLRQHAESVFKNADLWSKLQDSDSIVNEGTGSVAGAIEEERVDALMAYGAGGANLAGWATEVDARANLHLVEMTNSFQQAIKETRGTNYNEIEVYGWENQNFGSNMMETYGSDFQFWFGTEISRDVGYELAKISHNNVESIQEAQPAYANHSKPENMAKLYLENHPVHPGPYDFLEEKGVDMSSYKRGKTQG